MLEHQEYLSLIAELAVAFAGFTGIVAVFRFRVGELHGSGLVQFQTMLRASISALFLSLVPYLLYSLLGNEELAWRIGNLLVFGVMSANIFFFVTRGGQLRTSLIQRIMFPIGVSLAIANFLGAMQILPSDIVFIFAVSFQLFVSANNFILLIMSNQAEEPESSPEEEAVARD